MPLFLLIELPNLYSETIIAVLSATDLILKGVQVLVVHALESKPKYKPSHSCPAISTDQRFHWSAITLLVLTAGVKAIKFRDITFQFLFSFLLKFATGEELEL